MLLSAQPSTNKNNDCLIWIGKQYFFTKMTLPVVTARFCGDFLTGGAKGSRNPSMGHVKSWQKGTEEQWLVNGYALLQKKAPSMI